MNAVNVIMILMLSTMMNLFRSCQKNEVDPVDENQNILQEGIAVNILRSIRSYAGYNDSNIDAFQGEDIYKHLLYP